MSEAFKVGDRVRVVNGALHGLRAGDACMIESISRHPDGDTFLYVRLPNGDVTGGWSPTRFRRAEEAQPAPDPLAQLRTLLAAFDAIGPNARTLLNEIAQRLVKGAREHGDFDPTVQRDWTREAFEEDLDAVVYRALALQQRGGK